MLILGPLDNWIGMLLDGRINHYPLVHLLIFSLDHTLIFSFFLLLFEGWYWKKRKRPPFRGKWILYPVFFIYLFLLLSLTVFRYNWEFWNWRISPQFSLRNISWVPFVDTIKLDNGDSPFSYWYNFFGNVVWFIPFGFLVPLLRRKKRDFFKVVLLGALLSIGIELGQLALETGIAHIDDVIFNTAGVILGYVMYDVIKIGLSLNKKGKNETIRN